MKLRSHESYWLLKNGLIQTYASLQEDLNCDVLITGGGITGSLLAYQLSQEGYKTILIDKRDIGMGSTGATTAMLQYEIDVPLVSLIEKVGETAAVDSYREGVLAIERIGRIVREVNAPCEFRKKSSVYIADSPNKLPQLRKEFECRKQYQLEVSWLTQSQLYSQFGMVGEGAILSKTGGDLDAYNLAHALLAFSVKKFDLQVYDHSRADGVEYGKEYNSVLTDDGFVITCKHIVYASGYETQDMFNEDLVDLNSTYAFISEPLPKIPPALHHSIFWNTHDPYLYLRTTPDNRILVGGGDEHFEDAILRDSLIDKKERLLLKSVKELLPDVNLIPDFSWAGTFGATKDGLPYIGSHPDFPNSSFVLGFGGNGITFSVMGMSIISDALAGRPNKFLQHFRFQR
jgi:glycine/D-amino acid oxidase-like deaminating enzyme